MFLFGILVDAIIVGIILAILVIAFKLFVIMLPFIVVGILVAIFIRVIYIIYIALKE